MKKLYYLLFAMFMAFSVDAQITGKVVDQSTNEPVIGASVYFADLSDGTYTDLEGNFTLENATAGDEVIISYLGYDDMSMTWDGSNANVGTLLITSGGIGLKEVLVVADVAIDRKTPVAVSNIPAIEIEEKLGSQEFPEILKMTPSIYATKTSGGFGDARINVRGFRQEDVALMINGIPVNGMEDNKIYWSNWAGLGDVTRSIQVQRGLGASKLAVASVGGTINIITKTTDQEKGGNVFTSIGNDNYRKTGLTLSTGKMDNDWAFTIAGSRTTGDGYINGNYIDAYSYFFSAAKQINEKSLVMLTGFGAPQRHGQRSFQHGIDDLKNTYGKRWNDDYGYYRGDDFHWRENFYHKPQIGLTYINEVNDATTWVTSAYVSVGRGGGSGDIGSRREFQISNDSYGQENFNDIARWNRGEIGLAGRDPVAAVGYSRGGMDMGFAQIASFENGGTIKRASMNEHQWFGAISNVTSELSNELTFSGGIDLRWYTGSHYRKVIDLLGAEFWFDDDNINSNPDAITYISGTDTITESGNLIRPAENAAKLFGSVPDDQKIDYHNDENINWYGTYGQLEYSEGALSAFVSGAANYTQMRRIDFFNKLDSDPTQTTDWLSFLGGNVKLGANYNLDLRNNVFVNVGYISRAPYFDALFPTFNNDVANEDAVNEQVMAVEAGYGFRAKSFRVNLNGYYTQWKDKTEVSDFQDDNDNVYFLNLLGTDALHMGVELDAAVKVTSSLEVTAMASVGNWQWKNDPTGTVTDQDQNVIGETTLFLDGLKVGDAAQTTVGVGAAWKVAESIKLDAQWLFSDNLYAAYNPDDRDDADLTGVDPLKLPSYALTDLGATWGFDFGDQRASLRLNVNNLFDVDYISEAQDRQRGETQDEAINNTRGWLGFGRTWNATVKLHF